MAAYDPNDPFVQLALVVQTPGALPPLLWGTFGAAKSQRMAQMAEALNLGRLETLIGSYREPGDFAMPFPDGDHVKLSPCAEARRLEADGRGVLFLDELSCCAPATQAVMMRIALDREVGNLHLPDAVKVVAAANPPDEATGGWDLAYPLANRFWHADVGKLSNDRWADWLAMGPEDDVYPRLDAKRWKQELPKAKSLVAAYMKTAAFGVATEHGAVLYEEPKAYAGRTPPAIARPRTWECAARLVATALACDDVELVYPLCAGAIGDPQALSFAAWQRNATLPDPEELLRKPKAYAPDKKHPDRVFATLLMVVGAALEKERAKTKKDLAERWIAAWIVIEQALGIGKDICLVAARQLMLSSNRNGDVSDPRLKRPLSEMYDVSRLSKGR